MREILTIQAGEASNYVGTHFWNTQQEYFTYGEDDDSFVDHDVSWREGVSRSGGGPTYCPRAIVVDYKSKFGTLSQHSELYPVRDKSGSFAAPLWTGNVVEHRQELIPESTYAEDESEDIHSLRNTENRSYRTPSASKVRYWSDFSQTNFIPRSIHRTPDPLEEKQPGWNSSVESFLRYDREHEFVETSMRGFLEECDVLQGLNVIFNAVEFGGFSVLLLEAFREEHPKHPILCNLIHSDAVNGPIETSASRIQLEADAMCIYKLNELDCITSLISMQSVSGSNSRRAGNSSSTLFESSRSLAAMYESVTLPCRLRKTGRMDSLTSLTSLLNWRGDNRFVHLQGAISLSLPKVPPPKETALHDFSGVQEESPSDAVAIYATARGTIDDRTPSAVSEFVAKRCPAANYASYLPLPPSRSVYDTLTPPTSG